MIPRPLHKTTLAGPLQRAFLVVAAILLLSALCSPVFATRDVKVALTELKPLQFYDEQGKPAGFFVDIINDVALQENWNVIWVRGSLSESWARLSSGEIDLMPGVTGTPERRNLYEFSNESALSVWSEVYARPGSGINTILDLDQKQIAMVRGAQSGIAFQDYAKKFGINATYLEFETPGEVFAATAAGTADALVVYNTAGLEEAQKYDLIATPVMFNPTQFGFAVQKGMNHDLLEITDHYIAQGKGSSSSPYSQAMQKWFGIKATSTIPSWLIGGLAAVAFIALLFVAMSVILKREVGRKTAELSRQNEELQAAYEQLRAAEKELRENYRELRKSETALMQARKKLSMLNQLTFQDVQTGIFSLGGYLQLALQNRSSDDTTGSLKRGEEILRSVRNSLEIAKKYQTLGINEPRWQSVNYVLLSAISHMDYSQISRTVSLDNLEIYADPLLEDVFYSLMKNVLVHGAGATEIHVSYRKDAGGVTILIEDNGPGIPADEKEKIFGRDYNRMTGINLFFAREILSVTDISIAETGVPGSGARFEITVPEGEFRFTGNEKMA
jgi:ABC-type amino acid transport substrate-binding protein